MLFNATGIGCQTHVPFRCHFLDHQPKTNYIFLQPTVLYGHAY
jgi:hypothetical protein